MIQVVNAHRVIPEGFGERILKEELTKVLVDNDITRVEYVVSPKGFSSPRNFWYNQEENEFVMVINGAADLGFKNGTTLKMTRRDSLYIPAHLEHRIERVYQKTEWLVVFYR